MDNPVNYMKYFPLDTDNPVNYMKYIPLHGQTCKLYEIYILTWTTLQIIRNTYPYMDNPVNYMKYIPLYGHPCK